MHWHHLTNIEIAARLAQSLKAWRISPQGAGLSQVEVARKSGIGLTPLKRFEKTGAITMRNLVALMRALDLLDRFDTLVPVPELPGPLDILAAERQLHQRKRAPRRGRTRV
jgi:hypothetical protein